MAGVDRLEVRDTGIGPEPGGQLGVTDVDADDIHGAGLQRTVSESPGGSADIEHVGAVEIDGESPECSRQFFATATDNPRQLLELEIQIRGKLLAGFVEPLRAV